MVQALCYEIVTLTNQQPLQTRYDVVFHDVEVAAAEVFKSQRMTFYDIELNQIDECGRLLLRLMARKGEGAVIERTALLSQPEYAETLDETIAGLLRRELIEPVGSGYRFQVELIRQWFARREPVPRESTIQ